MDFNILFKLNEIVFSDRAIKTQEAYFLNNLFSIFLMETYSIIWM